MNDSLALSGRGRPVNEEARLERMQTILAGARKCFAVSGFHASSIAEISAAAKVSTANIYQYYPNKDALITALIEDDLDADLRLIGRIGRTDLSTAAIRAILEPLLLSEEGRRIAALRAEIISEAARNAEVAALVATNDAKSTAAMERAVEAAKQRGTIGQDIVSDKAAELMGLMYEAVLRHMLIVPARAQELLDFYLEYVESVISPPQTKD